MTKTATAERNHAVDNAKAWYASIIEMLQAVNKAESDNDREAAEQIIHESVLSVLVRDGWRQPGSQPDDGAEEYEILLSTGGPALRIYGLLNKYDEPETAELQWQDWGTPWTHHPSPQADLLTFARHFYFGG